MHHIIRGMTVGMLCVLTSLSLADGSPDAPPAPAPDLPHSPPPHPPAVPVEPASATPEPMPVPSPDLPSMPEPEAPAAADVPRDVPPAGTEAEKPAWLDRFSAGLRFYHFELRDTRRTVRGRTRNSNVQGNFIGSIWGLDEDQDYLPRLHVQYMFIPYLGAGLTYDHVSAETVDWGDEEATRTSSDGVVDIWGPMIYLIGRYPNSTRCTPFVELGWAAYFASFDTDPAWAATAPGYRFEVDDTSGYYFGAGVDIEVRGRWSVSLYVRRMNDAEVDARAYFTPGPRVGRYGAFPMEYTLVGLGASCRF